MKALALSALAALSIHALLFFLNPSWTQPRLTLPRSSAVTIRLAALGPKAPARKAVPPLPLSRPDPISPLAPVALKKRPAPRPAPHPEKIATPAPAPTPVIPQPAPAQAVDQATSETGKTASASEAAPEPPAEDNDQKAGIIASYPLYDINPPPIYPRLARRRQYEGTVLLEVLVGKDGRAAQVRVARSSGYPILDRNARDTVARWRFEPARRNGRPVAMRVEVPIVYKLN